MMQDLSYAIMRITKKGFCFLRTGRVIQHAHNGAP